MNKSTKLMVSLIACAAVMQAATAQADEIYMEVRSASASLDEGQIGSVMDAESSRGVGVAAGYELAIDEAVAGVEMVRVLGNYGFDTANGERFGGDVTSRWTRHRLMASTDVGFDVPGDRVRPLVRLGAGYSRQTLSLEADAAEYEDLERGFVGEVGGGLEVMILQSDPEGANGSDNLSLGANLLMGYTFHNSSDFDEMKRRGEPMGDVEHATYDAGSLNASGWHVGIGFVGSFRLGR